MKVSISVYLDLRMRRSRGNWAACTVTHKLTGYTVTFYQGHWSNAWLSHTPRVELGHIYSLTLFSFNSYFQTNNPWNFILYLIFTLVKLSEFRAHKNTTLTLQEAASGMHPEWQGGADSARPYKNQFRGHFDPIFWHNFDWGTKIT